MFGIDPSQLVGAFAEKLIDAALVAAAGAVLAYVLKILHQVQKKYGLQLDEAHQAQVDRVVADAIRRAEEWAAVQIKKQIPVTALQKHEMAVTQVMQETNLPQSEATNAVRSMLPQLGLGAAANQTTPVAAVAAVTVPLASGAGQ